MHTTKKLRLACVLAALAPFSFLALGQDAHLDPNDKAGKKKGGPNPKGPGPGSIFVASADLNKIMANPAELEKGRLSFENHCVGCHGPKGEGVRGPTLAQPVLPRARTDEDLLQIIQRGIPNTEMPAVRLKIGEAPVLAAYVRSLGKIPQEPVRGDVAKGAELFKTKGACMSCHTLNGQGLAIGPDLTDIGLKRSATFLRRSLTDPAAEVPQSFNPGRADISMPMNFAFVRAKTKDGKDLAGVRINENTFSIQFRDMTGGFNSYHKSELADLKIDRTSPMPVYAGLFSPAELDDVVAYLVSLKGNLK